MKKFITGFVAGSLIFGTVGVMAAPSINLIVNGKKINSAVSPQVINGSTMVPARPLAEALGARVEWDAASNSVIVTSNSTTPTDLPPVSSQNISQKNAAPLNSLTVVDVSRKESSKTLSGKEYFYINSWINGEFKNINKTYDKGIGFDMLYHGTSASVTYKNGGYSKLTGSFFTDMRDDKGRYNQLIIYGDGKELYKSPQMDKSTEAVDVNVSIAGVKEIKVYFDTEAGSYPVFANPTVK